MKKLLLFASLCSGCSLFLREVDIPPPECGNGVLEVSPEDIPVEACDDGDREPRDGCDASCNPEEGFDCIGSPSVCTSTCGDGVKASVEACDDGAANSDDTPNACRTDCSLPGCGDGIVDNLFSEQCDDGPLNTPTPDACRPDCQLPTCGDNITDEQEECDDGNNNSDTTPGACRTTCVDADCGDGVVDPGQLCFGDASNFDLGDANLFFDFNLLGIIIQLPGTFATADLNGDGDLDFVATAPGSNQIVSLFGNGDGTFSAPITQSTSDPAVGIAAADFDGDGIVDIAISRPLTNFFFLTPLGHLTVLTGNGDGTYDFSANLSAALEPIVLPVAILAVDVDEDLDEDLIAAGLGTFSNNNFFNEDGVRVLFNNGAGAFSNNSVAPALFAKNGDPLDVVFEDINGDQLPDIIAANGQSDDAGVIIRDAAGALGAPLFFPQGDGPVGAEVADFNQDGSPDLAFANFIDGTITISLQESNLSFLEPANEFVNPVSTGIRQLVTGDVDRDGREDLIMSINAPGNIVDVGVLLGQGDGTFENIQFLSAGNGNVGNGTFDLAFQDLNSDGFEDLLVVNLLSSDISILLATP